MSDAASPPAKAVSIAPNTETIIIDNPPATTSAPPRRALSSHKSRSRRRVPPSPGLAPSILTRDVIPRVSLDGESEKREHGIGEVLEDYLTHGSQNSSSAVDAAAHNNLLHQIREWVRQERKRRRERRERRKQKRYDAAHPLHPHQHQEDSADSNDESLDVLETLLASSPIATRVITPGSTTGTIDRPHHHRRKVQRKRSLGHLHGASDTEYASDGEALVPACEVQLATAEELGMDRFKEEVLKLTHTLKCKGWRRVALDRWSEIEVMRISGALTNAVYMISPPKDVPPSTPSGANAGNSTSDLNLPKSGKPSKYPTSLLLRIYGPQVSHLIDRDTELSILRRLARQKIGPRLLGTFINGRFEEYFPSSTLTKDDIRRPEVSRHIAKRLKELHEGIEVTPAEREAGPIVWKNWDKWEQRASEVIRRYESHTPGSAAQIIGSSWETFAGAVAWYRQWLTERCGGEEGLRQKLVFAHNDTQYGNILRLQAASNSPLLLPSNEHKQLIVIDFEYASANTQAWEFANHFCEWMSNYHDASAPHIIHVKRYPTLKEQRNFLRAYVDHSLRGGRAAATGSARNSGVFDLDGGKIGKEVEEDERRREEGIQKEVDRWLEETKVWRAAVHAMWAVWGIVQAKDEIAEREDREAEERAKEKSKAETGDSPPSADSATLNSKQVERTEVVLNSDHADGTQENDKINGASAAELDKREEEEEDFDYFGYAREKAGLFWCDMETLGLLKEMGGIEKPPAWAKKISDV